MRTRLVVLPVLSIVTASLAGAIAAAPTASASPPGDDSSAAIDIYGRSGSVTATTVGATVEPKEPQHLPGAAPRHSVWFRWHKRDWGHVTFRTKGSSFDTVLAVYSRNADGRLQQLDSDDDAEFGGVFGYQSQVSVDLTAHRDFWIAVDGAPDPGSDAGEVVLSWDSNDDFSFPDQIAGPSGAVFGTTYGSSPDQGELPVDGNPGGRSVWFQWQAPVTGRVAFDTSGSGAAFDTMLEVSRARPGGAGDQERVVAVDDECCDHADLEFEATAGTVYRVRLDGHRYASGAVAEGQYRLAWHYRIPQQAALSVADRYAYEESSGTKTVLVPVRASLASGQPVTVHWATKDGTAKAGKDYVAAGGTAVLAPWEQETVVPVQVLGDTTTEPLESFTVELSQPYLAALDDASAPVTITDSNPQHYQGRPVATVGDATVLEGDNGRTVATLPVRLSRPASVPVSYAYWVTGGTARLRHTGVDQAYADAEPHAGFVTFVPGQTIAAVQIEVDPDDRHEGDETVHLTLTADQGGADWDGAGTLTVRDDD
ncbi:Calx-beta domain-containing protein [Motilibacter deserti]|uniref:Calx-beta domain-containing protein n=1 Tax=Motilibacter deserti TaxID=2714956 RepID=A0ABX0GVL0_9ACTN|nr:Calx-beta domain-containing protein [Motilibacter deserti]NHC14181.1 hypothetical protein [Motilibacter deserti]